MQTTILGCGAWACALAGLLAKNGHTVCMWGRNPEKVQQLRCRGRHPNCEVMLPELLEITSDLDRALISSELIIESVTVGGLREVFTALRRREIALPLVLTSKGLESQSNKFPSQVADEIFGLDRSFPVCVLSGPSLAREVAENKPTGVVMACRDLDIATQIGGVFKSPNFHVFVHSDVLGVQFGGAFKNIIAIASGMMDGQNLGTNAKAMLLARSLQEMTRLAVSLGCMPQTLLGLTGVGDLIATSFSPLSRNFCMGRTAIEKTHNWQCINQPELLSEGRNHCKVMLELASSINCKTPILKKINSILSGECQFMTLQKELSPKLISGEWI